MSLLLVMAIDTHDTVFVLYSLVLMTDGAHELHSIELIRRDQAERHHRAAAGERVASGAVHVAVVQWSIARLTLVDADITLATEMRQTGSALDS